MVHLQADAMSLRPHPPIHIVTPLKTRTQETDTREKNANREMQCRPSAAPSRRLKQKQLQTEEARSHSSELETNIQYLLSF